MTDKTIINEFTPVLTFHLAHRHPSFHAVIAEEVVRNGVLGYHAVGNYTKNVEHEIRALFIPNHGIVAIEYLADAEPEFKDDPAAIIPARHEGSE